MSNILNCLFSRVVLGEYCRTTQVKVLLSAHLLQAHNKESKSYIPKKLETSKETNIEQCSNPFFVYLFQATQVIEETLSPTWDQLLVFDEILVYGRRCQNFCSWLKKRNPFFHEK